MRKVYKNKTGYAVLLGQEIGKGGEGIVYKSSGSTCIKVYDKPSIEKGQKLEALVSMQSLLPHGFTWPYELIFDGSMVAGFIMPYVTNAFSLFELTKLSLSKSKAVVLSKFDRYSQIGLQSRIIVCLNLCKALHKLHQTPNIIITDLKPQNILWDINGQVTLTDMDSVQLKTGTKIFSGGAMTAEYTRPLVSTVVDTYHMSFALAVILYEILLGIHPYSASFSGKYENLTSIAEKIEANLFVFGNTPPTVIPKPHSKFNYLPQSITNLFTKAFGTSIYNTSNIPSPEEWGRVFYTEATKLKIAS
jgi:DNA-binding helix-hairpin-helix protein with protein kinase domain